MTSALAYFALPSLLPQSARCVGVPKGLRALRVGQGLHGSMLHSGVPRYGNCHPPCSPLRLWTRKSKRTGWQTSKVWTKKITHVFRSLLSTSTASEKWTGFTVDEECAFRALFAILAFYFSFVTIVTLDATLIACHIYDTQIHARVHMRARIRYRARLSLSLCVCVCVCVHVRVNLMYRT